MGSITVFTGWPASAILIIAALILAVVFYFVGTPVAFLSSWNDEARVIFWTGAVAALIALWGVLSQRRISRRHATLDHLTALEADEDLIEAREIFNNMIRSPGKIAKLIQWVPHPENRDNGEPSKKKKKQLQAVRTVLNSNELIAIGIQMGIIDYELYKRYSRSTFIRDWNHAAPFVHELRRLYGSDSFYHEFEEISRWMRGNEMPRRTRWWSLWL